MCDIIVHPVVWGEVFMKYLGVVPFFFGFHASACSCGHSSNAVKPVKAESVVLSTARAAIAFQLASSNSKSVEIKESLATTRPSEPAFNSR
jgi:hypothetical protein